MDILNPSYSFSKLGKLAEHFLMFSKRFPNQHSTLDIEFRIPIKHNVVDGEGIVLGFFRVYALHYRYQSPCQFHRPQPPSHYLWLFIIINCAQLGSQFKIQHILVQLIVNLRLLLWLGKFCGLGCSNQYKYITRHKYLNGAKEEDPNIALVSNGEINSTTDTYQHHVFVGGWPSHTIWNLGSGCQQSCHRSCKLSQGEPTKPIWCLGKNSWGTSTCYLLQCGAWTCSCLSTTEAHSFYTLQLSGLGERQIITLQSHVVVEFAIERGFQCPKLRLLWISYAKVTKDQHKSIECWFWVGLMV